MAIMNVNFIRRTLAEWTTTVEIALRKNDWKGGWEGSDVWELQNHLWNELRELERALHEYTVPDDDWYIGLAIQVRNEAADIAALAMMIADVAGPALHKGQRLNGHDLCESAEESKRLQKGMPIYSDTIIAKARREWESAGGAAPV